MWVSESGWVSDRRWAKRGVETKKKREEADKKRRRLPPNRRHNAPRIVGVSNGVRLSAQYSKGRAFRPVLCACFLPP